MSTITRDSIESGFRKLLGLPQEKLVLVLALIDQLSDPPASGRHPVRLGIADGRYRIPDNINQYDDEIAEMFGVRQ